MRLCGLIGSAFLLAVGIARADPCKLQIETGDVLRYSVREMVIPTECNEVEVSLRHSGSLAAKIMGHDWVLARESDMSAIVNAGLAAGFKHGYLPEDDKRIIAATKIVGGGESATVRFRTSSLQEGVHYAFFCTSPGHSATMRGKLVFGGALKDVRASPVASSGAMARRATPTPVACGAATPCASPPQEK